MSSQKACRDLDALLSAYVDHEATADEMAIVESAYPELCRVRLSTQAVRDAGAAARRQYPGGALRGRARRRTREHRVSETDRASDPRSFTSPIAQSRGDVGVHRGDGIRCSGHPGANCARRSVASGHHGRAAQPARNASRR